MKTILTSIPLNPDESVESMMTRIDKLFTTFIPINTPPGYKYSHYALTPTKEQYEMEAGLTKGSQTLLSWRIEVFFQPIDN